MTPGSGRVLSEGLPTARTGRSQCRLLAEVVAVEGLIRPETELNYPASPPPVSSLRDRMPSFGYALFRW